MALSPRDPAALAQAIRDLDAPARRLLSAICACAPGGAPLEMAARTTDRTPAEAQRMASQLSSQRLLIPLDENGPRFLVPCEVREHADLRSDAIRWSREHALVVADWFGSETDLDLTPCWPDLQHAFEWALTTDWPLASRLARRAVSWAKAQDRLAEAFEILQDWRHNAEQRADRRVLEECAWEQIWILEHWGRPADARELAVLSRERYANQLCLEF